MNYKLLLALCLPLAACEQAATAPSEPIVLQLKLDDALSARLAAADAADGTADHVVEKCISCSLKMAGKAGHSVTVNDYQLHLCSADCQVSFAKDAGGALLALPEPSK